MKKKTTYLLLAFALSSFMIQAREIKLSDFGVKPWSYENASPAIVKALGSAKGEKEVVLVFPGGRVDLWPEGAIKKELYISNTTESDTLSKVKNLAICLENFTNITIEGNNTLLVLHGKMISFAVLHSENVTIKDIRFDYERPTMSELKVTHLSDTLTRLKIHPDTRLSVREGKVTFFGEGWKKNRLHTILAKPEEKQMYYSSWMPFSDYDAQLVEPDIMEFKGDLTGLGYEEGAVLTMRDPYRDNCGAFINRSKDVRLENVKMHYMHGMGIVSQFTENITLKKVEVAPREESGRIVAAFADCFHFSGCKGKVVVDSCRTSGSHDDPMNVHGTHLKITKIEDENKITVRFMHHQTWGFEAFFDGDSVAFVKPENLLVYDFGKIRSAKLISKREMVLEMEGRLPDDLKQGDCLENTTWTPSVVVKNCRFERTNTRGLLLTTRRSVTIENNTFYRTGMHGILIANDCNFWYESGPVSDVIIRGNKFIQCGYNQKGKGYLISIQPETHNFDNEGYIHSNIRIEHNIFESLDGPILFARSVNKLWFNNNEVKYSPLSNRIKKPSALFKLEHCKEVKILDNTFVGFANERLEASHMKKSDVITKPRKLFK